MLIDLTPSNMEEALENYVLDTYDVDTTDRNLLKFEHIINTDSLGDVDIGDKSKIKTINFPKIN